MAERKETRKIERERDCVAKNHTNMVTSMIKEGIEKEVHATLTSIGKDVVNPFYSQQLSLPDGKKPKSKPTVFTPAVFPFSPADQRDEHVLTPSLIAHTIRLSTTTSLHLHFCPLSDLLHTTLLRTLWCRMARYFTYQRRERERERERERTILNMIVNSFGSTTSNIKS